MRTKTLLLSAAALVAGLATSQAQVYSQNVVGYATLTLNPSTAGGYQIIAPTLDVDGTGTNGTIQSVLGTNCANQTSVFAWNGVGFDTLTYTTRHGGSWLNAALNAQPTYPLNVGEGFWIIDTADSSITVSGNVLQGALTNAFVPATAGTYSLISDQVPIAGGITTVLGYQPANQDSIFIWDTSISGFDTYTYTSRHGGQWLNSALNVQEPQITVGQGFWLIPGQSGETWGQVFNVQ